MPALPSASEVIASLDRDDVLEALHEIDREGLPLKRRSVKFCLQHKGRHYPAKLAISFASAYHYADEPEFHKGLDPNEFVGGPQSNKAFGSLGFVVMSCQCGGLRETRDKKRRPETLRTLRELSLMDAPLLRRRERCGVLLTLHA
jgi:hypothetical protein